MSDFCFCGATAGCQHRADCPRPLFRASESEAASWTAARARKREQIANANADEVATMTPADLVGLHPVSSADYASLCASTLKVMRLASELIEAQPEPRRAELRAAFDFHDRQITSILAGY